MTAILIGATPGPMDNKFKRGDKVRWAANFIRGKDPAYGLRNERMLVLGRMRPTSKMYKLKSLNGPNQGMQKLGYPKELIKID